MWLFAKCGIVRLASGSFAGEMQPDSKATTATGIPPHKFFPTYCVSSLIVIYYLLILEDIDQKHLLILG